MAKKKVFISFDFDNDKTLKEFIVGQARNPDSPFEIVETSLKEAEPWWVSLRLRRLGGIATVVLTIALGLSGLASANITVSISADPSSNSSDKKVAPSGVFFEASAADPNTADLVHGLKYEWNFGDAGAGTLTYGRPGDSANAACCTPWAAHTFETAGTYTITLTVTNSGGEVARTTKVAYVSDPSSVYGTGSSTNVCLTDDVTKTGWCPYGLTPSLVSENSFDNSLDTNKGKRIFLRCGGTYSWDTVVNLNAAGTYVTCAGSDTDACAAGFACVTGHGRANLSAGGARLLKLKITGTQPTGLANGCSAPWHTCSGNFTDGDPNGATPMISVDSNNTPYRDIVLQDIDCHDGWNCIATSDDSSKDADTAYPQVFLHRLYSWNPTCNQNIWWHVHNGAVLDSFIDGHTTYHPADGTFNVNDPQHKMGCNGAAGSDTLRSGLLRGSVFDGVRIRSRRGDSWNDGAHDYSAHYALLWMKISARGDVGGSYPNIPTNRVSITRFFGENDWSTPMDGVALAQQNQNPDSTEEITNTIVENSSCELSAPGYCVVTAGNHITLRNNTCKMIGVNTNSGCFSFNGIARLQSTNAWPNVGVPPNLGKSYHAFGNSCRSDTVGGGDHDASCVIVDVSGDIDNGGTGDLQVKNNVLFDPSNSNSDVHAFTRRTWASFPTNSHADGHVTGDGNVTMIGSNSPFAGNPPTTFADWKPTGAGDSSIVDQGASTMNFFDATGITHDITPTVGAREKDSDDDGVADDQDNCVFVPNPKVDPISYLTDNHWATLTGGQRDDDGDGYGNACDWHFPNAIAETTMGEEYQMLSLYAAHTPPEIDDGDCGTPAVPNGPRIPCAVLDLNGDGHIDNWPGSYHTGTTDFDILFDRACNGGSCSYPYGAFDNSAMPTNGNNCPSCPLKCVAGTDGHCP